MLIGQSESLLVGTGEIGISVIKPDIPHWNRLCSHFIDKGAFERVGFCPGKHKHIKQN